MLFGTPPESVQKQLMISKEESHAGPELCFLLAVSWLRKRSIQQKKHCSSSWSPLSFSLFSLGNEVREAD